MAYLSNQNNVIKTDFNINTCGNDEVFLNDLQANQLLVSYNPLYLQNNNGKIAGVDDSFSTLYIIENDVILKTFNMTWHSDCKPILLNVQPKKGFMAPTFIIPIKDYLVPSFIILITLIIYRLIRRR
jgi:hypothetical protein